MDLSQLDAVKDLLRAGKSKTGKPFPQLAREIGVNQSTVQKWHSGDLLPSEEILPKVAAIYELELARLEEARRLVSSLSGRAHPLKLGRRSVLKHPKSSLSPFTPRVGSMST